MDNILVYTCLQNDLVAGISVAALVIPQGMSYAKLAGLPNQYGLYGAFVPVIIYATLGSSRHLVSGHPLPCPMCCGRFNCRHPLPCSVLLQSPVGWHAAESSGPTAVACCDCLPA